MCPGWMLAPRATIWKRLTTKNHQKRWKSFKNPDRLEHNKQGKLPSMVAEYLRVQVPLTADFECVCKTCLSPDVSYGKRSSTDLYCRTCACTAGKSDLRATEYIDLNTNRVLHPVELEVATGLRCLPLAKSCPRCHHCQWERTVLAGKETVTIEIDGIWRYAAANYCCLRCGYRFEYTNPLTYTTATHLPGKPVIASTAVAIEAIKHFIDTQRHDPHYTPSAFVNCRLPVSGASICTLVAKEGSIHRAFIGYSGSWIAADKP